MPQRSWRSAIVGTGGIADAHAHALQDCAPRSELVAAVDLDPARAKVFAAKWEVAHTYPDVATMLDEIKVDLVHICTPPAAHAGLAEACLRAGRTVLVEKPPAVCLGELAHLVEVERAQSGHLATVFQHRCGAGAARLRRLAAAGILGRPLLASCDTQWYRDEAYFAVPWRGTWASEGGGPTMGHGIHQFDLMLSVLGDWNEVTAMAARQARDTETEDVSLALVSFANGALATVTNSVVSPRQTSALRFDYERATVEVEHLYGYTDDDWRITPAPGHEDVVDEWERARASEGGLGLRPSSHTEQLTEVLDALDRGEAPPTTMSETWRTMEFVAAVYASAFTGQRVKAGEITSDHPFARTMRGSGAPWERTAR